MSFRRNELVVVVVDPTTINVWLATICRQPRSLSKSVEHAVIFTVWAV